MPATWKLFNQKHELWFVSAIRSNYGEYSINTSDRLTSAFSSGSGWRGGRLVGHATVGLGSRWKFKSESDFYNQFLFAYESWVTMTHREHRRDSLWVALFYQVGSTNSSTCGIHVVESPMIIHHAAPMQSIFSWLPNKPWIRRLKTASNAPPESLLNDVRFSIKIVETSLSDSYLPKSAVPENSWVHM